MVLFRLAMVVVIREKLAELYEFEQQWSRAAQMLSGIDLDSGIRMLDDKQIIQVRPDCTPLFGVNVEAFINKASFLVTNSNQEVLNLQYKVQTLDLDMSHWLFIVLLRTLMVGFAYNAVWSNKLVSLQGHYLDVYASNVKREIAKFLPRRYYLGPLCYQIPNMNRVAPATSSLFLEHHTVHQTSEYCRNGLKQDDKPGELLELQDTETQGSLDGDLGFVPRKTSAWLVPELVLIFAWQIWPGQEVFGWWPGYNSTLVDSKTE
ncbi:hypothetical protein TRIUR3_31121 [Triticum urartu]|uniref:Uncharacterized protein n=1 Tax=Triticum urartu TaxID=4572 RepID=M7YH54_TRIUA|nr:hypothetical protein TRIUR3_31121 [Triticum urartu]